MIKDYHIFKYTGTWLVRQQVISYLESTPGINMYSNKDVWLPRFVGDLSYGMSFEIECDSIEDETVFRLMFP